MSQPRDALGQFASRECPTTYRLLVEAFAPPEEGVPNYYAVQVARCPHGHFARWAAANCKRCR